MASLGVHVDASNRINVVLHEHAVKKNVLHVDLICVISWTLEQKTSQMKN